MMMLPTQGFVKKLMLTLIQRFEVAHMVKIQNLKDMQGWEVEVLQIKPNL